MVLGHTCIFFYHHRAIAKWCQTIFAMPCVSNPFKFERFQRWPEFWVTVVISIGLFTWKIKEPACVFNRGSRSICQKPWLCCIILPSWDMLYQLLFNATSLACWSTTHHLINYTYSQSVSYTSKSKVPSIRWNKSLNYLDGPVSVACGNLIKRQYHCSQ